jgi:hypothetical protein
MTAVSMAGQFARHVCITCCCILIINTYARTRAIYIIHCINLLALPQISPIGRNFPSQKPSDIRSDPTCSTHVKVDPCGSNITTILSSGNRETKLSDCGSSTCPIQRYHCRYQCMFKLYGGHREHEGCSYEIYI